MQTSIGVIAGVVAALTAGAAQAVDLGTAVRTALESHPEVQQAAHQRFERDEDRQMARAGRGPVVDLRAGYGYEWARNRAGGNDWVDGDRREASVHLTQPIYDGGLAAAEIERQHRRVTSGALAVTSTAQRVALEAAEAYLELLRTEQLVKLSEHNLEHHRRVHDQVRLRTQGGLGSTSDLDQASARLALAEANLIADQGSRDDAVTAYLRVVGRMPDAPEAYRVDRNGLPASVEEALERAARTHPTLRVAQADVDAALSQRELADALLRPTVDLEVAATVGSVGGGDVGLAGREDQVLAMLRLNYNLYDGGHDRARRRQAEHLISQARDVHSSAARDVEQQVRLAWHQLGAVDRRLEQLDRHARSSERARDAYRQQFGIGERTLLDLLDAENELYESLRALIGAETDQQVTALRLRASVGDLLPHLGVTLPDAAAVDG